MKAIIGIADSCCLLQTDFISFNTDAPLDQWKYPPFLRLSYNNYKNIDKSIKKD
jgi:hypothetical protein